MSTIWTFVRATAVVGGSSAALLLGGLIGTAHADPPPPAPAPNIGQQLISSLANAPQILQNIATAVGLTPQAPAGPPPLASGEIRAPQPLPATVLGASPAPGVTAQIPGITPAAPPAAAAPAIIPAFPPALAAGTIPAIPATPAAIPGITPVTPAAAPAGPAQLMPTAQVDLPKMPFLPVPLPQQLSLPGDLAALTPGGVPVPPRGIQPSTPAPSPNALSPLSALP